LKVDESRDGIHNLLPLLKKNTHYDHDHDPKNHDTNNDDKQWKGCFSVTSPNSNKTTYYLTETEEDATAWVNAIHQGGSEARTRRMGHGNNKPYPSEWSRIDAWGTKCLERNIRLKKAIRRSEEREMEMSTLGDGGMVGALPRGYYG